MEFLLQMINTREGEQMTRLKRLAQQAIDETWVERMCKSSHEQ